MNLACELRRYLRNFKYEKTERGVHFPIAHVEASGVFGFRINNGAWQLSRNITAYEGTDAMLLSFFGSGTKPTGLYVVPFTTNTAPTAALTAATFGSTQGEYTGYTEATRPVWTINDDLVDHTVSNSDSPAAYTVGTDAATIRGAALIGGTAVKGATTGKLIAASLFTIANTLNPGSTFSIKYGYKLTPAS